MDIVSTETADETPKKLVVLLGNFHTQMSFLGTMGHIMENSGLSEIFETTYARNSVKHILSGKAHDRAVHTHNLLSTVLQRKNSKMALIDANMIKDVMEDGPGNFDTAFVDSITQKLMSVFENSSRQVKLWLQYIKINNIMMISKSAGRTGN